MSNESPKLMDYMTFSGKYIQTGESTDNTFVSSTNRSGETGYINDNDTDDFLLIMGKGANGLSVDVPENRGPLGDSGGRLPTENVDQTFVPVVDDISNVFEWVASAEDVNIIEQGGDDNVEASYNLRREGSSSSVSKDSTLVAAIPDERFLSDDFNTSTDTRTTILTSKLDITVQNEGEEDEEITYNMSVDTISNALDRTPSLRGIPLEDGLAAVAIRGGLDVAGRVSVHDIETGEETATATPNFANTADIDAHAILDNGEPLWSYNQSSSFDGTPSGFIFGTDHDLNVNINTSNNPDTSEFERGQAHKLGSNEWSIFSSRLPDSIEHMGRVSVDLGSGEIGTLFSQSMPGPFTWREGRKRESNELYANSVAITVRGYGDNDSSALFAAPLMEFYSDRSGSERELNVVANLNIIQEFESINENRDYWIFRTAGEEGSEDMLIIISREEENPTVFAVETNLSSAKEGDPQSIEGEVVDSTTVPINTIGEGAFSSRPSNYANGIISFNASEGKIKGVFYHDDQLNYSELDVLQTDFLVEDDADSYSQGEIRVDGEGRLRTMHADATNPDPPADTVRRFRSNTLVRKDL